MISFFRRLFSNRGFFSSSLSLLGQDGVITFLSFLTNIVLARWLGPFQLGLFYILNLIPSYSEKFGRLGLIDQASIYFMGKKKYEPGIIFSHLIVISALMSLIPVLASVIFKPAFQHFFLKDVVPPSFYYYTIVATTPFVMVFVSNIKFLVGSNQAHEVGFLQVSRSLVFLLLALFFWWRRWDYFGICLAGLLVSAGAAALSFFFIQSRTKFRFDFNKELVKDLFGYGWVMYLVSIFLFIHLRSDLLMVSLLLKPQDVTFYSLAVTATQLLWRVPVASTGLLMARVASGTKEEGEHFTAMACRINFAALIAAAVGLFFVAWPSVRWFYGSEYMPLMTPLVLLLPGTVSLGIGRLLTDQYFGSGRTRPVLIINVICAALNIGLNYVLIPRWGLIGAAMVSSFTYTLETVVLLVIFLPSSWRWRDVLIMRRSDWDRLKGAFASIFGPA